MDAKKVFKTFLNELRSAFPDKEFTAFKDSDVKDFEEWCTPHVLKILQKDSSIFEESFMLFGQDLRLLYPTQSALIWKHLQTCGIASFLGDGIKEKIGKLMESVKGIWNGAGHSTDEIDKILGDAESHNKISEILEFVMSTRLAKVVLGMAESVDLTEFGVDFENPDEVMNLFQNMQGNPIIEKIMKKIQKLIEERLQRGDFTKEMIVRDIESIKVRLQTAFGDMFNDMLGARKADVPAAVLLGNSPEARRARMLARLQRKVNERKTQH
jgi:hypothetical protein